MYVLPGMSLAGLSFGPRNLSLSSASAISANREVERASSQKQEAGSE